ncbi:hypothetical protein MTsPCn9_00700 [Croceitalea sp. MTPC9]|uniref:hypothetical protein n=1 Tax=unclassified Croceitalea TaxID=2632280 RepID=UPI002B3DBB0E|nr:hypothetical protein MTsPCn6_08010 [Croceitalea sp. MTPC6]GMN15134.1 hypothetical protein MTsPCn9_00700 [Croceitalea sp. MTPC9]
MRKLKLIVAIGLFVFSGSLSANTPEPKKLNKNLSAQIQELLQDNAIDTEEENITAAVWFMLNEESEIVVLDIDSDRLDLKWFVKRKLKGKKLASTTEQRGKQFVVNVLVKP